MSYNYYTKRNHEDPLLYLDFHHHIILVRCNESSLIQKLRDEFHFFAVEEAGTPEFVIDIFLNKGPELPSMVASSILENAAVYTLGNLKYVDYFGEALIVQDYALKTIKIHTPDLDRAYELGFLCIHSLIGQELDLNGMCRVHAVTVSIEMTTAVIMLPSKGGKSTLLKNLLENPETKIVSDDMPIVDLKGHLHPFPSKISLSEKPESGLLSELTWNEFRRHHYPAKWTASLSQLKNRIDTHADQNRTLLIAGFRLSSGDSMIMKVSKWKMIGPLLEHMIIGLGLPQIVEIFLKFQFMDFFKMIKHASIRTIAAINLARKSECFYFYMGPDKSYNSQLVLDVLYEHQNS